MRPEPSSPRIAEAGSSTTHGILQFTAAQNQRKVVENVQIQQCPELPGRPVGKPSGRLAAVMRAFPPFHRDFEMHPRILLLFALIACLSQPPAHAAAASDTLAVSAHLVGTCLVTAGATQAATTEPNVRVECSADTVYSVEVEPLPADTNEALRDEAGDLENAQVTVTVRY